MSDTEYDVIVAGYGPVGETCANLLGYYGIKALILDKEKETFPLPRAITWDAECQRAMTHCNFLTDVKTRKIRGVDNKDAIIDDIKKDAIESIGGGALGGLAGSASGFGGALTGDVGKAPQAAPPSPMSPMPSSTVPFGPN